MRITILKKLMAMMLVLTVIPLVALGTLSSNDAKSIGLGAADDARVMGEAAIIDSTAALNSLGEKMIRQTASFVAKQLEVYILENPDMTIEDLQGDDFFRGLAIQDVGETGYTAVFDAEDSMAYFHPNEVLVDTNIKDLSEKLPEMWEIVGASMGAKESGGYYDWEDADGVIRPKYMYIVPVQTKTKDGVILEVAATTYIDEFSAPEKEIRQRLDLAIEETVGKIEASTEGASTDNTIFMMTLITVIFVVIISYLFARSLSRPIVKLKDATNKITSGEPAELPVAGCNDEVCELIGSVEMLIASCKIHGPKLKGGKK